MPRSCVSITSIWLSSLWSSTYPQFVLPPTWSIRPRNLTISFFGNNYILVSSSRKTWYLSLFLHLVHPSSLRPNETFSSSTKSCQLFATHVQSGRKEIWFYIVVKTMMIIRYSDNLLIIANLSAAQREARAAVTTRAETNRSHNLCAKVTKSFCKSRKYLFCKSRKYLFCISHKIILQKPRSTIFLPGSWSHPNTKLEICPFQC